MTCQCSSVEVRSIARQEETADRVYIAQPERISRVFISIRHDIILNKLISVIKSFYKLVTSHLTYNNVVISGY